MGSKSSLGSSPIFTNEELSSPHSVVKNTAILLHVDYKLYPNEYDEEQKTLSSLDVPVLV